MSLLLLESPNIEYNNLYPVLMYLLNATEIVAAAGLHAW